MEIFNRVLGKHSFFENLIPGIFLSIVLALIVVFPVSLYISAKTVNAVYLIGAIIVPFILVPLIYYISNKIIEHKGDASVVDKENLWTMFFIFWFKIWGILCLITFLAIYSKIIFNSVLLTNFSLDYNLFVGILLFFSLLFSFIHKKYKIIAYLFSLLITFLLLFININNINVNSNLITGYFQYLTNRKVESIVWISLILWGGIINLHRAFNVKPENKGLFLFLQIILLIIPFTVVFILLGYYLNSGLNFVQIMGSYYKNSLFLLLLMVIVPISLSISLLFDEFKLVFKIFFPGVFIGSKKILLFIIAFLTTFLVALIFPAYIIAELAMVLGLVIIITWDLYALFLKKDIVNIHSIWLLISLVFAVGLFLSMSLIPILLFIILSLIGQLFYSKVSSFYVTFNRKLDLLGDVDWLPEHGSVLLFIDDIKNVNKSFKISRLLVGNDVHLRVLITHDRNDTKSKKKEDLLYVKNKLKGSSGSFSVVEKSVDNLVGGINEILREEKHSLFLLQYSDSIEKKEITKKLFLNIQVRTIAWSHDISKSKNILVQVEGTSGEDSLETVVPILQANKGSLLAINSVEKFSTRQRFDAAVDYLTSALSYISKNFNVSQKTFRTDDLKSKIKLLIKEYDLYVMGVDTDLLSNDVDFLDFQYPTLLVKQPEFIGGQLFRKIWLYFYKLLPKLSKIQQELISKKMLKDSIAGIDFYVLILFSSGIAYFGLLQNSSAVIIGGMLVAPLMIPMMAVAHSVIQGNSNMLQNALASMLKGIGLVIFSSFAFTVLIGLNVDPTFEILARTTPNVLDLFVAIISGGAAAYAISRKTVAAALPGVAISAALVPPLCVVGYGLGVVNLSVAFGAFLLFGTNVIAIIVSSMIVFLLLGFRPYQFKKEKLLFRKNLMTAILFLLLISVPLINATISGSRFLYDEKLIRSVIHDNSVVLDLDIDQVDIYKKNDTYFVTVNILVYNELNMDNLFNSLNSSIENRINNNIELSIRVIDAKKLTN